MIEESENWIAARIAGLSTGVKLLLILSLGLLPLLIVAILASAQSAQQKNSDRRDETLAGLEDKAQQLDDALSRGAITINTASAAIALSNPGSPVCETMLRRLETGPIRARYALYGADLGAARGRDVLRCASAGFAAPPPPPRRAAPGARAVIAPGGGALLLFVFGEDGLPEGVAELGRDAVASLTDIPGASRSFDLALSQPGREMTLRHDYRGGRFRQTIRASRPVAGGQLHLTIMLSALPITALDVLMISLPVLMWIFAALIGWAVLSRLLLRPLVRMQRAVAAYRPGDSALDLPRLRTPAQEMVALGDAFDELVRTVARHEANLEAAVERQTRLVREVHHRVKNNLQVVASLLNLHARGSPNEEVAAAYASIQRRVDALAVVHRNHYAELEENRGVALKPLISELAANLRATAPAAAAGMAIRLDIEPFYATQDVAVSVAFLITEIVEFAMLCGGASVAVSLTGDQGAVAAAMVIESESLRPGVVCSPAHSERFERIVTGLSRQLRSTIAREPEFGRYALAIAVVDKAERG